MKLHVDNDLLSTHPVAGGLMKPTDLSPVFGLISTFNPPCGGRVDETTIVQTVKLIRLLSTHPVAGGLMKPCTAS